MQIRVKKRLDRAPEVANRTQTLRHESPKVCVYAGCEPKMVITYVRFVLLPSPERMLRVRLRLPP